MKIPIKAVEELEKILKNLKDSGSPLNVNSTTSGCPVTDFLERVKKRHCGSETALTTNAEPVTYMAADTKDIVYDDDSPETA